MKVVKIKWDTDGDMKMLKSLPKEIDISDEFDVKDYEDDQDQLLDDISDWLSDTYGYCPGLQRVAVPHHRLDP